MVGVVETGPSGHVRAANWTLEQLQKLGLRVPSTNRLENAKCLIQEAVEARSLDFHDHSFLRRLAGAQKTISELYVLTRALWAGEPVR